MAGGIQFATPDWMISKVPSTPNKLQPKDHCVRPAARGTLSTTSGDFHSRSATPQLNILNVISTYPDKETETLRRERICPRSQSKAEAEPSRLKTCGSNTVLKTQTQFCHLLVERLHIKSFLCNISFPRLITSTVLYPDYNLPVKPQSQQATSIIPTPQVSLYRKSHLGTSYLGTC